MKLELEPPKVNGQLFSIGGVTFEGPSILLPSGNVRDWYIEENSGAVWRYASLTSDVRLEIHLTTYPSSNLVRFHMSFVSSEPLLANDDDDALRYYSVKSTACAMTQIELSHWDPIAHSYMPGLSEHVLTGDGEELAGPIVFIPNDSDANAPGVLLAYEHGADTPNSFLAFRKSGKTIELVAKKGNYVPGSTRTMESVGFLVGIVSDAKAAQSAIRAYMLEGTTSSRASREPLIFYNTWNSQERLRYETGAPYLSQLNTERVLAEIDKAHQMGIDVFVIDTGWYSKTGDWLVDPVRFPDGLRAVRKKLDSFGMKLGLWFNPVVAAKSSQVFKDHPEWVMSQGGKANYWGPIWETEESFGMCLCSGYANWFADKLIELHNELGVSYFKWDAVGQYGCDSTDHDHGSELNSQRERVECYGFESGRRLTKIMEKVSSQCPGTIIDFDVTEHGRYMGLGLLRAGKYFLVNNGPYYHDFDIPSDYVRTPDTINVFFHPGPARSRVCRKGIQFDGVIPSILFLTHYYPDGPRLSQENAFASLVLGGNGIWGSLLELSDLDIEFWHAALDRYKRVARSATNATSRTSGQLGSSPEIYEKIDADTGEGLVAFFTVASGEYSYVTQSVQASATEIKGADHWKRLDDGRIKITVALERDGARVVTFCSTRPQVIPKLRTEKT